MRESDSTLIDAIRHYQDNMERYLEKGNIKKMLYSIEKLEKLPIKVSHLEETGIGRTVNGLRKLGGEVSDAAKSLVAKWKGMVVEEEKELTPTERTEESDNRKSELKKDKSSSSHRENDKHSHHDNKHKHSSSSRDKYNHPNNKHKHEKKIVEKSESESESSDDSSDDSSSSSSIDEEEERTKTKKSLHKRNHSESEEDNRKCKSSKHSDSEDSDDHHKSKKHSKRDSSPEYSKPNKKRSRSTDSSSEQESHHSKSKHKTTKQSESNGNNRRHEHTRNDDRKHNKDKSKKSESHSDSTERHTKHKSKSESQDKSKHSSKSLSKDNERSSSKSEKSSSKKESDSKSSKESKSSSDKIKSDDLKKSENRSHSSKSSDSSKDKKTSSSSSNGHKLEEKKYSSKTSEKPEKKAVAKTVKAKNETVVNGFEIDSGSGASFAEALGMCGPVGKTTVVKKKSSSTSTFNPEKSKSSSSSGGSSREKSSNNDVFVPKLLQEPELPPLEVNIAALLPEITPNYRPLGNSGYEPAHKRILNDDEALSRVITSKNQRTKVYSGNKVALSTVPSLFDLSVRVLQDNVDALEYTGGVPYLILKPILEKCNPNQLFTLEHHNPYLIEDTDELWVLHCQKEFRTKQREELESWREMYMRCLDERDAKLKALTANIKQAQDKSIPIRTTKLAYVDSVVKPPRNVARKQMKNGTAFDKKPAQTPSSRLQALATSGEASKVAVPNPGSRAADRSGGSSSSSMKPAKKAPLMAKTLSFMKNRFKR